MRWRPNSAVPRMTRRSSVEERPGTEGGRPARGDAARPSVRRRDPGMEAAPHLGGIAPEGYAGRLRSDPETPSAAGCSRWRDRHRGKDLGFVDFALFMVWWLGSTRSEFV
ncbi:proline-rich receptor-like protein kinase PERK9 [Iris pallida]|uniref:Proline-rich receptor-like protein kinase PERK9 n=1 Tax=Iris pallida TaxID=29817 RepID=A0AAX6I0I7_IRIPA|nr:proline-rich receptor-like protein kinase PERK9 [Iris pallida]